ncbi:MAG: hypothetical protein L0G70_10115 [Rubrobacter sp.]|nr:hypothetical protein [Rubrobacter sp.]
MREEFFITRQGKTYILFAGLLDEAHSRGLAAIDTDLVQIPEDSNGQVAITKATVTIETAEQSTGEVRQATFSGIGDASPQNVSRNIVPHLIRMSETRAKARALRDAVNVGATSLEELTGDDDDGGGGNGGGSRQGSFSQDGSQQGAQGNGSSSSDKSRSDRSQSKATASQIEFLKTLAEEWRGEQGVSRLESRIGKSLDQLTRDEAESWVERLTPKENPEATESAGA